MLRQSSTRRHWWPSSTASSSRLHSSRIGFASATSSSASNCWQRSTSSKPRPRPTPTWLSRLTSSTNSGSRTNLNCKVKVSISPLHTKMWTSWAVWLIGATSNLNLKKKEKKNILNTFGDVDIACQSDNVPPPPPSLRPTCSHITQESKPNNLLRTLERT